MLVGTWYLFPEQQTPPPSPHSWARAELLQATLSKNPLEELEYLSQSTEESKMQYLDAVSK